MLARTGCDRIGRSAWPILAWLLVAAAQALVSASDLLFDEEPQSDVILDGSVTFVCVPAAGSADIKVRWLRNGVEVSPQSSNVIELVEAGGRHTLHVRETKRASYRCQLERPGTTSRLLSREAIAIPTTIGEYAVDEDDDSLEFVLIRPPDQVISHSARPEILYPTDFLIAVRQVTVSAGRTGAIPCAPLPTSTPPAELELLAVSSIIAAAQNLSESRSWYRPVPLGDAWMPGGDRRFQRTLSANVYVRDTNPSDTGYYRCVARNPLTGEVRYATFFVHLNVRSPSSWQATAVSSDDCDDVDQADTLVAAAESSDVSSTDAPADPGGAFFRDARIVYGAPARVEALIGNNVTLDCLVDGWPPPTVVWRRVIDPVVAGEVRALLPTDADNSLTLAGVSAHDAGLYECQAGERATLRTQLVVLEPPQLRLWYTLDISDWDRSPADDQRRLTTGDELRYTPLNVVSGASFTLGCTVVRGQPAPDIRWIFNGRLLSSAVHANGGGSGGTGNSGATNNYEGNIDDVLEGTDVTSAKLPLRRVSESHQGHYQCFASNQLGETYAHFVVRVERAPLPTGFGGSNTGEIGKTNRDAGLFRQRARPPPPLQSLEAREYSGRFVPAKTNVNKDPRLDHAQQTTAANAVQEEVQVRPDGRHASGRLGVRGSSSKRSQASQSRTIPIKLTVLAASNTSIELRWPDVESIVPNANFLKVQYKMDEPSSHWRTPDEEIPPESTSFVVKGLKTMHRYRFRLLVVGEDDDYLKSRLSSWVTVCRSSLPDQAASGLSAEAGVFCEDSRDAAGSFSTRPPQTAAPDTTSTTPLNGNVAVTKESDGNEYEVATREPVDSRRPAATHAPNASDSTGVLTQRPNVACGDAWCDDRAEANILSGVATISTQAQAPNSLTVAWRLMEQPFKPDGFEIACREHAAKAVVEPEASSRLNNASGLTKGHDDEGNWLYFQTASTPWIAILHPLVTGRRYAIKIAAYNKSGCSPYTRPVFARTMDDAEVRTYLDAPASMLGLKTPSATWWARLPPALDAKTPSYKLVSRCATASSAAATAETATPRKTTDVEPVNASVAASVDLHQSSKVKQHALLGGSDKNNLPASIADEYDVDKKPKNVTVNSLNTTGKNSNGDSPASRLTETTGGLDYGNRGDTAIREKDAADDSIGKMFTVDEREDENRIDTGEGELGSLLWTSVLQRHERDQAEVLLVLGVVFSGMLGCTALLLCAAYYSFRLCSAKPSFSRLCSAAAAASGGASAANAVHRHRVGVNLQGKAAAAVAASSAFHVGREKDKKTAFVVPSITAAAAAAADVDASHPKAAFVATAAALSGVARPLGHAGALFGPRSDTFRAAAEASDAPPPVTGSVSPPSLTGAGAARLEYVHAPPLQTTFCHSADGQLGSDSVRTTQTRRAGGRHSRSSAGRRQGDENRVDDPPNDEDDAESALGDSTSTIGCDDSLLGDENGERGKADSDADDDDTLSFDDGFAPHDEQVPRSEKEYAVKILTQLYASANGSGTTGGHIVSFQNGFSSTPPSNAA